MSELIEKLWNDDKSSSLTNKAARLIELHQEQIAKLEADKKDLQARLAELTDRDAEFDKCVKSAFWWSAEFTNVVHNNNIQNAWEDFLTHPHGRPLKGSRP